MEKITFVIPSRNNLEFLQLAYKSIRDLDTKHDILILNDASTDGTQEWIKNLNDNDLLEHYNPGPERIGIVGMFDKGIEMARTSIIFAYHADMIAAPDLDKNILKYLKPQTVVSATRVEPPLHPPGPEKIIQNFGIETDEFDEDKWLEWNKNYSPAVETTEGIFAPWCMYKEDFLAIGGHDELFAPQSKEDSDLFNRFHLAGYKFIQSWQGRVYHFTSRGSRFNKHAGGGAGKNSDEWLYTTNKNMRNFIRKWGTIVQHDHYMKPIISPKYDIGYRVENCNQHLLTALEPWGNIIYVDNNHNYIESEQQHTTIDLKKRVHALTGEDRYDYNDIVVEIDGTRFTNEDFELVKQLPEILKDSGEIGEFRIGNLKVTIITLETYEKELIKL